MNAKKIQLRLGGVCGVALLFAMLAWGKTYTMQTTPLEPGAVAKLDATWLKRDSDAKTQ
jgi:hypothetical protein